MSKLPDFFVQYDLPADADERAIKRVYARQLKLIDQETDLEGFQALRDTFEEAIAWLQYRQQTGMPETSAESDEGAHRDSSMEAPQNTGAYATHSQHHTLSASAKTPELADPEATAEDIIVAMINDMRGHYSIPSYAGECFLRTMEDTRLIHMETGLIFERMLAHYLLQGWQPGNGELLDVVADYYGWKKDVRRLHNWGEGGYVLSRALTEQAEFNKKSEAIREGQWALLLKARYENEPAQYYLSVHFPMMLRMLEMYPTWVLMVSSRNNIEAWHARYADMQQGEAVEPAQAIQTAIADQENTSYKTRFLVGILICFALFIWMAGLMDRGPETSRVYTPVPLHEQTTYLNNSYLSIVERKQQDLLLSGKELKEIGDQYFSGHGGKVRNVIEAVYFWEMASEKGNVEATYQLAWMYDLGNGVAKDMKQAHQWYEKAAKQGERRSQVMMGNFYLSTVNQDVNKAVYFYELAAAQGDMIAKRALAAIYDEGMAGQAVDLDKASIWYAQAAMHDDLQSKARLKSICRKKKYSGCTG